MISYEKRALRFSATVLPPSAFLSLLMARHIKPLRVERKPAIHQGRPAAPLARRERERASVQKASVLEGRVDLLGRAFLDRRQGRAQHVLDPAEPRQRVF